MIPDPVRYSAYDRALAIWDRNRPQSRPDPFIPPPRAPRTWRQRLADRLVRLGAWVRVRFVRVVAWLKETP